MGNESSKSKTGLRSFNLKSGPFSSILQQHLENAKKSRVLQLKNFGLKVFPPIIENVKFLSLLNMFLFCILGSRHNS